MKEQYGQREEQTDTHLAKKYNDALFDCIMRCNITAYVNESTPHYENLLAYIAAVDTFFINTFFLFQKTQMSKESTLTQMLMDRMELINAEKNVMKYNGNFRTPKYFKKVANMCRDVHMMIMFGLQRRNMLVRVSEKEPRGMESINYWDEKAGFKKGAVPYTLPQKKTGWN